MFLLKFSTISLSKESANFEKLFNNVGYELLNLSIFITFPLIILFEVLNKVLLSFTKSKQNSVATNLNNNSTSLECLCIGPYIVLHFSFLLLIS